jgi:hypothetical protein
MRIMPSAPARVSYVSGRTIFRALYAAEVIVIAIMRVNGLIAALFLRRRCGVELLALV